MLSIVYWLCVVGRLSSGGKPLKTWRQLSSTHARLFRIYLIGWSVWWRRIVGVMGGFKVRCVCCCGMMQMKVKCWCKTRRYACIFVILSECCQNPCVYFVASHDTCNVDLSSPPSFQVLRVKKSTQNANSNNDNNNDNSQSNTMS